VLASVTANNRKRWGDRMRNNHPKMGWLQ